ncbi:LCP family protein [Anthocerotibacter panamensis]|uniref:LCP family protein n=1 Tax=Anthocerotibacter panamensis TaxID=2857077 RepID=UPI001C402988|nr:LCP family protein [Anthocerotibacter panamensis]
MKRPLFWAVTALLMSMSVGAVLLMSNLRPFHTAMTQEQQEAMSRLRQRPKLGQSLNILVLGTDIVPSKQCNENNFCTPSNSLDGRSDTIMLVRFAPEAGKVNVISIPRDSRVLIPGYGKRKINEANINGGAALAAETVSNLLGGVPINHYVRINPLGVIDLIDSVGGVRVYVKKAIRYSDDTQHLYINLPQGWQTLGGQQAQQYLRFRHDELGDIGRVQRQQEVIRALAEKALRPDTLVRLPDIFQVIQRNVDTDLSVGDLLTLARFGLNVDRDRDLQLVLLPGRFSTPGEFSSSFWIPDEQKIQGLSARYLGQGDASATEVPSTLSARIAVQNATGAPISSTRIRQYFREQGFENITVTARYPTFLWRTEIIAQQGDIPLAEAVQKMLGVGGVRKDSTGQISSDITIRLGKDWAAQHLATPS